MVFFSTLTVQPDNVKEVANKYLSRVGLSFKKLDEKYKNSEEAVSILSLTGKFVYMNETFNKIVRRNNDEDLMVPMIYIMLTTNPENIYLRDTLTTHFINRNQSLQYLSDIHLSKGGRTKGKFNLERVDTNEGEPYLYIIETLIFHDK